MRRRRRKNFSQSALTWYSLTFYCYYSVTHHFSIFSHATIFLATTLSNTFNFPIQLFCLVYCENIYSTINKRTFNPAKGEMWIILKASKLAWPNTVCLCDHLKSHFINQALQMDCSFNCYYEGHYKLQPLTTDLLQLLASSLPFNTGRT